MKNDETIALVLAGGGAKGSYQAEIASRICERKNVGVITGVSAGALNGAILAQGHPPQIRNIWKGLRRKGVWDGGYNPIRYIRMAIGSALGLFTADPLIERLKKEFDPNAVEIPFEAGAVSLEDGRYVPYSIDPDKTYDKAQVKKARRFVAASSAVPVAVEPIEVEGELFTDGGIRNIAPVKDAIDYEPDRIIAIFNSRISEGAAVDSKQKPKHAFGVATKAMQIMLNETVRSDVMAARRVNESIVKAQGEIEGLSHIPIDTVEPSEDLGSGQDFSKEAYKRRTEIARSDWQNRINL
jgi:NTE family protein